ncbi:Flagellar hook-length control protein FliK [Minicystis rosea]|nr:Flagellar hook-length control protein FliK [Minicystis rosea]
MARRAYLLGLGLCAYGLVSWIALRTSAVGAIAIVWGVVVMLYGRRAGIMGGAVERLNAAINHAQAGRVAEAEEALDEVEARPAYSYVARLVDVQRGEIALRRGDLDEALARAERGISRRPSFLTRVQEGSLMQAARALRALSLAAKGEASLARADIAAVRAAPDATMDALARAEVAEAVVLERAGDRAALAAHLTAERRLLLERTAPRERAVIRAYQRMLRVTSESVYRKPSPRDAEPALAGWMATISPAAARFAAATASPIAGEPPSAEAAPNDASIAPDLRRAAEERSRGKAAAPVGRRMAKVLAVWVALIMGFLAVWHVLNPADPARPMRSAPDPEDFPAEEVSTWVSALGSVMPAVVVMAVMAGAMVTVARRNRRMERALFAASRALARAEEDAEAQLEALVRLPAPLVVGQAALMLAYFHEQRATFEKALTWCERGIAAVTAQAGVRNVASAVLLPDLVAERALLLAVTDAHAEARAEMDVLATSFPSYPRRALADLRVTLAEHARRGDLTAAARLAAARSEDLSLPLRDETLADLAIAAAHPEAVSAPEIERLKDVVRQDAELRTWLEAVAPRVLAAFAQAGASADDPSAEHEALAEEEAQAASAEHEALTRA